MQMILTTCAASNLIHLLPQLGQLIFIMIMEEVIMMRMMTSVATTLAMINLIVGKHLSAECLRAEWKSRSATTKDAAL